MWKKILLLLLLGTLPMFAKSHGGSIDIYTVLTYIIIGSVLIIFSGFIYFIREMSSFNIEGYMKLAVFATIIVFLVYMIHPLFLVLGIAFFALIMIVAILIDVIPKVYKKLFK